MRRHIAEARTGSRRLGREGFTLLEVMVTLFLSVIVVSAMFWASLAARHSVRMGTVYMQASSVARSIVEQIKSADFDAVADDTLLNVVISDNATDDDNDDVLGTVTVDVTDNGNETKTVLVTVDWTTKMLGGDKDHQVNLNTLVTNL